MTIKSKKTGLFSNHAFFVQTYYRCFNFLRRHLSQIGQLVIPFIWKKENNFSFFIIHINWKSHLFFQEAGRPAFILEDISSVGRFFLHYIGWVATSPTRSLNNYQTISKWALDKSSDDDGLWKFLHDSY